MSSTPDPATLSAVAARDAIRSGTLSPVTLVDACLARIRELDPGPGRRCTRLPYPLAAPRDVVEAHDGAIYVTEMAAGRLSRLGDAGFTAVADGLAAPIGVRELPDGALVVAPDADAVRHLAEVVVLDATTTELLARLATPLALDELVDAISEEVDASADRVRADVAAALDGLVALRIVEVVRS